MFRGIIFPDRFKQFFDPVIPAHQVQPAQQALKACGGAVFLRGGMLGHAGFAGIFAAAQDVLLFLGQHRLNKGKLLVLRVGRYIMRCHTVQPTRLQAGCFHQTLADQQFQHGIPRKSQRQR